MKLTHTLFYKIFSVIAKSMIYFVGATSKIKIFGYENYLKCRKTNRPIIFALWHENIFMAPLMYFYTIKQNRLVSLASRSKDGELVAQVLQAFGGETVRGSSSRGGSIALKKMAQKVSEGWDAALIPDGPIGPPLKARPGFFYLASLTSSPVIPCAVSIKRFRRLQSWDRFKIPWPFNRIALTFGAPMNFDNEFNDKGDLTQYCQKLEEEMARAERIGQKYCDNR